MTPPTEPNRSRGFTLLELMVSMTVLAIIMALVFQMLGSTQKAWASSKARTSVFREAREAFASITQKLSQATLNTYWDYERVGGAPRSYEKKSDLHFVSAPASDLLGGGGRYPGHAVFFQAPGGFSVDRDYQAFPQLLNAYGFYVEFDSGDDIVPSFLPSTVTRKSRFRLMEFRPPAEDMAVYKYNLSAGSNSRQQIDEWFRAEFDQGGQIEYSRPIAENILLLIIEPKEADPQRNSTNTLASNYIYDSRSSETSRGRASREWEHVLPPILDVTMVAMDEESAVRYEQINGVGSLANLGLQGLFTATSRYENDLRRVEEILTEAKIDFRIFRETVAMKNSAWESETTTVVP